MSSKQGSKKKPDQSSPQTKKCAKAAAKKLSRPLTPCNSVDEPASSEQPAPSKPKRKNKAKVQPAVIEPITTSNHVASLAHSPPGPQQPLPHKSKANGASVKPVVQTTAKQTPPPPPPMADQPTATSPPQETTVASQAFVAPSSADCQNDSRKLTSSFKMGIVQDDDKGTVNSQDGSKGAQPQVRVLNWNDGDHLQQTLFRLEKGYILQLRPGPSLFGKKINVFTNHPTDLNTTFMRHQYRRLQWKTDSCNKGDDTALYVEVVMLKAGTFHFYLTFDDNIDKADARASGYFLVDPVLTRGQDHETLPLDGIQCQTFLAKGLGTLDRWPQTLQVAKESGYNMIHFTPIQELGGSRSGYSLRNQLKLNPEFSTAEKQYTIEDVQSIVQMMERDWKVLSLTDIVLNHTANEAEWIQDHTECSYNLVNSPHLRPAYLVDRAIYHLALEINDGKWEHRGIPKALVQESQVQALASILYDEVLSKPKVEEFFLVNEDAVVQEFSDIISEKRTTCVPASQDTAQVEIIQDPLFGRFTCTIDMEAAVRKFNVPGSHCSEETRVSNCISAFRSHVTTLNTNKRNEIAGHLHAAVGCILGAVRYERLQGDGPKITEVSPKHPLVPKYFTHYGPNTTGEKEEAVSFSPDSQYVMAHNGWVMGDDPLSNFAASGSNVYLRRELNAWGDSIKLRFGDGPEDCPYLWDHMTKYVEETARVFHGIRLDNCHSTPIHVAEYLLDCARRVRPDLYVIAELFTSSAKTDNVFVNRLGITSLIREAMAAPDSHELGRLVYLYGGDPMGAFILPPVRPLVPSIAHAMLLDITHDNKSPCETRTAWDMLPTTALVNMASCASGSTRGYDEIVPHHIHVVQEERLYPHWSSKDTVKKGEVNSKTGITACKRIINDLHFDLAIKGYNQVFVDQVTEHVVTVTRHNPVTHESVVLVAFTSVVPPSHISANHIRSLKVQGKFEQILFELAVKGKNHGDVNEKVPGTFIKDPDYINGVDSFDVEVREHLQPSESAFVKQVSPPGAHTTELEYIPGFRPGCVIAFKLSLLPPSQKAVIQIRSILDSFVYKQRISEVDPQNIELLEIVKKLSLSDLNRVLYRCEQEEQDEGRGWSSYSLSKTGPFVYCGLQGMISVLADIRQHNDLGHPFCGNLRDGDWLLDYVSGRLKLESSSEKLGVWLEEKFNLLKAIPRYLIPAYFDALITAVYLTLINHAWTSMSKFIDDGSDFAKALGLCSVQFCGVVKSALLPSLSPNLNTPQPPTDGKNQTSVTISAGLPHFCVGYMRNWGRDTFIALPGNLLLTGRFDEARWVILGFAATLRHGLIPNLLDGGANSRFNCRDSVWFWLYSIQQYVDIVPNGHNILKDTVSRLFPQDDSEPQLPGTHDQPLEDVVHEALQRHFQGVKFRERNAGSRIDSQMKDEGFNNEIGVNLDTGFPFGGNQFNCGTWMDKMGSSEKAGNKGTPSTPRDGSAVEIVGLCKSSLRFLNRMYSDGKYSFKTVQRKNNDAGKDIEWTYQFWEQKIADNFEKFFWIGSAASPNECRPDLINRRGIYKDTVGATQEWADYQLRCNFPIALTVAPEMISAENGQEALRTAEESLLGPLGIKTLDPTDWAYRGDYDNSNDSSDSSVSHGSNYHQGPEWLWPVGWFLRAKLAVARKSGHADQMRKTLSEIKSLLAPRFSHLLSSQWRSLPELTNSNGTHCQDSNPAQSWSTGCLLEVLWEMNQLELRLESSTL